MQRKLRRARKRRRGARKKQGPRPAVGPGGVTVMEKYVVWVAAGDWGGYACVRVLMWLVFGFPCVLLCRAVVLSVAPCVCTRVVMWVGVPTCCSRWCVCVCVVVVVHFLCRDGFELRLVKEAQARALQPTSSRAQEFTARAFFGNRRRVRTAMSGNAASLGMGTRRHAARVNPELFVASK